MAANFTNKVVQPLLIVAEDDPDDQLLLQDALAENNMPSERARFVGDGRELMELLATLPPQPVVVLLDLNMPRLDGREALRAIKANQKYRHIPVLILSTSTSEDDVQMTYQNGANSFFTKPALFSELIETVSLIKRYWFERAMIFPGA